MVKTCGGSQAVDAGGPVEHRYRLIDTAGSELGIVELDRGDVAEDEVVNLPDGTTITVVEIYDDEHGRGGGVIATLVIDDE